MKKEQDKGLELTIQYKKVKLLNNFFLLLPKRAVIGNSLNIEGEEFFITEDGTQIEAADNISSIQDESVDYLFDQTDSLAEEMEFFEENLDHTLDENDLEEVEQLYFDSFYTDIGLLEINNDQISIVYLEKKKFISIFQQLDDLTEQFVNEHGQELSDILSYGQSVNEIAMNISNYAASDNSEKKEIDVQELEDYVNERIIGHKDQIEDIATILAMNYQTEDPKEMEHILVAGPTGVGKTETFEIIAEYLKVPFVNYATTTLSDTGLVGKDVEDILKYVLFKANGSIEKTKRAIIVLDEIDKLAIRGNDVSQESVQQNLLKLLEGHTFDVRLSEQMATKNIDTSFMSFIGCGAFSNIFTPRKPIGIQINEEQDTSFVDLQSFLDFGMIPELMGRFGQIQIFQPLTEFDRYLVLTKSKISPFIIKQGQFSRQFGVTLQADESYYQAILQKANHSLIGLRGLKNAVNHSLLKLENQLLKQPGIYKDAFVSEETVKNAHQYILK